MSVTLPDLPASSGMRHYATVTLGYWAFTITDGAIRMLIVLYFHRLGFSPLDIALLFLFYEVFGVVTNLLGGWLGSRIGLNRIMQVGMVLQVSALLLLTVPENWLSIGYVMGVQALSGVAKDLNKMSAKTAVKRLVPANANQQLLRWTSVLTGSKNTLKGAGFFIGALLLTLYGFRGALLSLAIPLALVLLLMIVLLPPHLGTASQKAQFRQLFSHSAEINYLSLARFFLFGARDIWFVVALPVFLANQGWQGTRTGAFLALWIIGYGIIQAVAPRLLYQGQRLPGGTMAVAYALCLSLVPAAMVAFLMTDISAVLVVTVGVVLFGIVFAINSALHSYLVLRFADNDKTALDVGFYYMSNAFGRLTGTVLSGWVFQSYGIAACLACSSIMILLAGLASRALPKHT